MGASDRELFVNLAIKGAGPAKTIHLTANPVRDNSYYEKGNAYKHALLILVFRSDKFVINVITIVNFVRVNQICVQLVGLEVYLAKVNALLNAHRGKLLHLNQTVNASNVQKTA